MAVQKRIAQLGIAKQTAKGTAATAPTYTIGLTGGNVYSAEIEQSDLNTSWSARGLQGHDRISVVPGVGAEAPALPKSIGLLLMLALGSDTVVGLGPYTHKFVPSSALPYHTVFGLYGAEKAAVADCKMNSLEFSWDKTGALKVKFDQVGRTLDFASAWTIGATAEQVSGGLLKGVGGTFQVGGVSATVVSGSIKIENSVDAIIASASTTPDDVFEGDVKCGVSLTIVPDDMTQFRRVVTGTTNGTAVQSTPVYGAIDLKWVLDANTDLAFNAPRAAFMTSMPDVAPEGGAAEITLEGACAIPTGSPFDPFSFTLRNNVATY